MNTNKHESRNSKSLLRRSQFPARAGIVPSGKWSAAKGKDLFVFLRVHSWLILFLLAPALRAETFYLTVAGLGGAPEYDQRFSGWAKDIDKLLKSAEPNAKVETLLGAD